MGRKITKDDKKHRAEQSRAVRELEGDKFKLDFLRDNPHIKEAIVVYLVKRTSLSDKEMDDLRIALEYLDSEGK
jgi:hypothetical protein